VRVPGVRTEILGPGHECSCYIKKIKITFMCFKKLENNYSVANELSHKKFNFKYKIFWTTQK
jgi:hypothetical protein